MRKVFLENLPRKRKGNFIDWKNCVGYIIHFIYDDVEGDMEIIDYITNTYSYVSIKYLNEVYNIRTDSLKICNLGTILKRYTSDFKIKIGQTFKDDKRDLIIIDLNLIQNGINIIVINVEQNYGWKKVIC